MWFVRQYRHEVGRREVWSLLPSVLAEGWSPGRHAKFPTSHQPCIRPSWFANHTQTRHIPNLQRHSIVLSSIHPSSSNSLTHTHSSHHPRKHHTRSLVFPHSTRTHTKLPHQRCALSLPWAQLRFSPLRVRTRLVVSKRSVHSLRQ